MKIARVEREFDSSKYSTRFIALKFAYLGQKYNGFEYHANNKTPLPTIEETLWKALDKARLIFPTEPSSTNGDEVNWEGCDYSKCGRTDRGVSAFGQVVGIRVRSNRPLARTSPLSKLNGETGSITGDMEVASSPLSPDVDDSVSSMPLHEAGFEDSLSFDPIKDELPYPQILNRLLPSDIRILAWCPAPPLDFSARFSCRERRYRYFFTQPAFVPTHGDKGVESSLNRNKMLDVQRREGWLDIEAMRNGAKRFEGLHDFRNFCKVDASKQIDNFERRIYHADIVEVDPASEPAAFVQTPAFSEFGISPEINGSTEKYSTSIEMGTPKVYIFVLHGSAFLWHQVRHMVAILFLIGQGLESPDLVSGLLDVRNNPSKPMYEMAEDAPLVLWDCIFPREGSGSREDAMDWVYIGDQSGEATNTVPATSIPKGGKYGTGGIVEDLWKGWRQRKMDEILAGMLLNVVVGQGHAEYAENLRQESTSTKVPQTTSQKVFHGGDEPRLKGKYVPVLDRPRMESVEAINARYAVRKGFEQKDEVRDTGFRKVNLEARRDHGAGTEPV